jgi:hypothetical protein
MSDLKDIVVRKTHESSIKNIDASTIPSKLLTFLDLSFLTSIATTLSSITRNKFNYTGRIIKESDSLKLSFTSSEQKDVIDMIIKYDLDSSTGFQFINLNQQLEKIVDVKPIKPVETVVAVELPIVQPIKFDPDKIIASLTKQEEEIKKKKSLNAFMGAIEQLENKQKNNSLFDEQQKILNFLLQKETKND